MSRGLTIAYWLSGSISRRIGIVMTLIAVITAASAVVSLRGLSELDSQLIATSKQQAEASELVMQLLTRSESLSSSARRAVEATSPEERNAALNLLNAAKKELGSYVDIVSERYADAAELKGALQDGLSSFIIGAVKIDRYLRAGKQVEAERELMVSFNPKLLAYVIATVSGVTAHAVRSTQLVAASGDRAYQRALVWLLPIVGMAILMVAVGQWLLHTTVLQPVRRIARAAEKIASGRFDVDLDSGGHDECGEMFRAMATLREQLMRTVTAMQTASQAIVSTADELAGGNRDLSTRTQAQVRAFRSASTALESLNQMTQQNATGAERVARDMQAAYVAAQRGNDAVGRVVETMQANATASRRVTATIGVIRDIAFKTNLLALNAAVESARAGEHGRGFAVVANEVRALATQCANAAKQIETLIQESAATIERGTGLGAEARAAIQDIVGKMQAAANHMESINDASRAQSLRAAEVTSAIEEIDTTAQLNADIVSNATVATETLRNEALSLTNHIAGFTQSESRSPSAAAVEYAETTDRSLRVA